MNSKIVPRRKSLKSFSLTTHLLSGILLPYWSARSDSRPAALVCFPSPLGVLPLSPLTVRSLE